MTGWAGQEPVIRVFSEPFKPRQNFCTSKNNWLPYQNPSGRLLTHPFWPGWWMAKPMGIEPISMSCAHRMTHGRLLVQQVTKQFGKGESAVEALKPIDLSVQDGDFVCIVGPSGCGKSTLLNILAGFDYPTSGTVHLDGKPIAGPGPERGVVF